MGFHRRIITQKLIERTEESRIMNLLNADAIEMDMWSEKFFKLFKSGKTKQESIDTLNAISNAELPYLNYSMKVLREEMKEKLNKG
jgi:hypothetical protein